MGATACTNIFVVITILIAIGFQIFKVETYEFIGNTIDKYGNDLLIRGYLPDSSIRFGAVTQLKQRLNDLNAAFTSSSLDKQIDEFVTDLKSRPFTAEATKDANDQHYEVDTSFYDPILGYYKKYSSTIYLTDKEKANGIYDEKPSLSLQKAYQLLNESEIDMLNLYLFRAELCTGTDCKLTVLDLGCGWGSFSLFYAKQCPNCKIISISNSDSQIAYINSKAEERGHSNLKAMKHNVNELDKLSEKIDGIKFDRVVSVEMFEHMKNYEILLRNIKSLMKCDGKLFVHMFVHKDKPYHFEDGWMSKWFFTGGTMISHGLLNRFNDDMEMKQSWIVNGVHYSYTLETWLHLMDVNEKEVKKALGGIYGNDDKTIRQWWYLWRAFFIACSELFKYKDGTEWFVGNYLLTPKC